MIDTTDSTHEPLAILRTLSDEQLAIVTPVSADEVRSALERGAVDQEAVLSAMS